MSRKSRKFLAVSEEVSIKEIYNVGAYVRISKKNNNSNSIQNQILLINKFLSNKDNFSLKHIYSDNGFSGTNFNRPSFKNLISDINSKKINCIIVKDLSRFGRNYIEVGDFIENFFIKNKIRFISINDNFDTFFDNDIFLVAIKNIVNDAYSKDISKKVCTALEIKQKRGEFIGTFAPYGYKKSINDKNKLEIDYEVSFIIQKIFKWSKFLTNKEIAENLNKLLIPSPSNYRFQNNILKNENLKNILWNSTTVKNILKNPVYFGNLVQGKTKKALYKGLDRKQVNPNDWIITKNTHPPIINQTDL